MSFKQGIPLLEAFEDADNAKDDKESDEDSDIEPTATKFKGKYTPFSCTWKYWLLAGIICMLSIGILILGISLPLALIHSKQPQFNDTVIHLNDTVIQSPFDTRQYSVFTLNNSLRVMVISDNETQVSAAAMDVAVGSFSDPPNYEGLAHFCEHMLFYGSKKYPEEGAYSDFLTSHGGYDNAYTSFENTNYFFKVNSEYLHDALDRFAQFFIAPILSQDGVSREVNAVDAEHRKNLQNDGWRLWQLLKNISNPYHPFHQFNTGNLETLNKPDIVSVLTNFYQSHYSANQMQLVIYGREDIANLTSYAKSIFSPISNKNIQRPYFSNTSFPAPFNSKIVYYIPVANVDKLTLYWQVAPLRQKYREQVSNILSELLGHEGHGSVLNYLKTKQWAIALSAGTDVSTDTYTFVALDVTLTQNGLSHISEVIAAIIQYIKLLQNLNESEMKQHWNDFVKVATINFDYYTKISPDKYVSTLASTMRIVTDPNDFLKAPQRFVFSYSLISSVVSSLTPSTPIIFIGSQSLSQPQQAVIDLPHPQSLTLTEPIYGTQYEIMSIPESVINQWTTTSITTLKLPVQNCFIPHDLNVLPLPSTPQQQPMKINEDKEGLTVWWLQDSQFRKPKVVINCNIYSPQTNYSLYNPEWTALTLLYTGVVSNILNPEIYPAALVGYSTTIIPNAHGLQLTLSGFTDTEVMMKVIDLLVNAMTNKTVLRDMDIFSLSLEQLTTSLNNYNYTALPYHYVYQYIQSIVMDRPSWHYWQLLQTLQSPTLTTDKLILHMTSLFSGPSTLLCFLNGNINESQALNYAKALSRVISVLSSVDPRGLFTGTRLPLSPGNYSVIVPSLNPQDINSVVNVVFQIGPVCSVNNVGQQCSPSSLTTRALAFLMTLAIQQSCFDVLRTKQQLGYVAYCTLRTNQNIISFQVLVQSGTRNASLILDRIDQFLLDSIEHLNQSVSSLKLESIKNVYREILARKDLDLNDATSRIWYQISSGLEQFNYRSQVNDTLNSITSQNVTQFYIDHIINPLTAKKLVIAVYGKGTKKTLDAVITYSLDYTQVDPQAKGYP